MTVKEFSEKYGLKWSTAIAAAERTALENYSAPNIQELERFEFEEIELLAGTVKELKYQISILKDAIKS